jgi:hypothetical protein
VKYHGNIKNMHRNLIEHARKSHDFQNYSRFNTIDLINCMQIRVSNFFFKECKAPMADRFMMIFVKSIAGIQFTSKIKQDILYQGNGLCQCGEIGR